MNIGVFLSSCVGTTNFSIANLLSNVGTSFTPLTSFIPLALTGYPPEAIAIIGIFTGIITGIQIYIIAEIIASHIPLVDV
jgi:hypothetical protein